MVESSFSEHSQCCPDTETLTWTLVIWGSGHVLPCLSLSLSLNVFPSSSLRQFQRRTNEEFKYNPTKVEILFGAFSIRFFLLFSSFTVFTWTIYARSRDKRREKNEHLFEFNQFLLNASTNSYLKLSQNNFEEKTNILCKYYIPFFKIISPRADEDVHKDCLAPDSLRTSFDICSQKRISHMICGSPMIPTQIRWTLWPFFFHSLFASPHQMLCHVQNLISWYIPYESFSELPNI